MRTADDLERIVDSQFSKTRITIKTPWVDSVVLERFMHQVKAVAESAFEDTATVKVTGGMALMARTIPAVAPNRTPPMHRHHGEGVVVEHTPNAAVRTSHKNATSVAKTEGNQT